MLWRHSLPERRNLTTAEANRARFGQPHALELVGPHLRPISWHSSTLSARRLLVDQWRSAPLTLLLQLTMAAVSLSVSTVKPLGDRIFIKVSASEETTAGGILLPDTAKEKPQVGEVVQVGPGKRNDDGSRQAPEVGVGDKVLYSKYAGTDIKLGSDEYVLLSEKDILAVVN